MFCFSFYSLFFVLFVAVDCPWLFGREARSWWAIADFGKHNNEKRHAFFLYGAASSMKLRMICTPKISSHREHFDRKYYQGRHNNHHTSITISPAAAAETICAICVFQICHRSGRNSRYAFSFLFFLESVSSKECTTSDKKVKVMNCAEYFFPFSISNLYAVCIYMLFILSHLIAMISKTTM